MAGVGDGGSADDAGVGETAGCGLLADPFSAEEGSVVTAGGDEG